LAEEVARQLNDPEMVESARRESDPDLGIASCLDIGRAWFAAGHPEVALSWVDRSEADHTFMAAERDDLQRDNHTAHGKSDVVEQLTWKRFREHRSPESLQPVLALIGEHRRDQVIAAEADAILADDSFDPVDAIFLIESGLVDEAARYVLTRPHLLDAHSYGLLRPMAKAFRRVGYHLAASAVLRTLLDDILARGYSPAYGHAARYLHELDALWEHVSTWDDLLPHPAYVDELRKRHGRKSGFWSRYQEAGDASGDRRKGSRR
jgi:hypothetical protein